MLTVAFFNPCFSDNRLLILKSLTKQCTPITVTHSSRCFGSQLHVFDNLVGHTSKIPNQFFFREVVANIRMRSHEIVEGCFDVILDSLAPMNLQMH